MATIRHSVPFSALIAVAACGGGATSGPQSATGTDDAGGIQGSVASSGSSSSGNSTTGSPSASSGTASSGTAASSGTSTGVPQSSGAAASTDDASSALNDAAAANSDATATGTCDRACLLGVMSTYLNALVAKDPSKIKTASTLKYTENGVVTQLGSGLWKTASSLVTGERLDFADPSVGQVASQLVVDENGTSPVLYMVRLKVVQGEITEIESMAVRQQGAANGFFQPANLKPQPVFATVPAPPMTRAELTTLMNDYLDYLDGKVKGSAVPFDTNCNRYENGVDTANGVAAFDEQSWSFSVVRRILIVDEEAGIVWGMFPFEMTATALVVGEAFKMIGGKIMMIQAVMANMPANAWN
jgi:hypothetical protein